MRIYTRRGDSGWSGLAGGERFGKDSICFDVLGDLDELNAWLGWCRTLVGETTSDDLARTQRSLIGLSAQLAGFASSFDAAAETAWLESRIDRGEETLAPLTALILPGGCPAAAGLHVARAVCRRAERWAVSLEGTPDSEEPAEGGASGIAYLNRLSDFLYILARQENRRAGVAEEPYA